MDLQELMMERAALNASLDENNKKIAAAKEAFENEKQQHIKMEADNKKHIIQALNREPIELMANEHHAHRPAASGRTGSAMTTEYTNNIGGTNNVSPTEDAVDDCCCGHISGASKDALSGLKGIKSERSTLSDISSLGDTSVNCNSPLSYRSVSPSKETPVFEQALTSDNTAAFMAHIMHELKNELKKELQARVDGDFKRSIEERLIQELAQELIGGTKGRIYYELREELKFILKRDITFKVKQDVKREMRLEMVSQLKYDIMEDVKGSVIAELKEIQNEVNNEMKNEIKEEVFNRIKVALTQDALDQLKDTMKGEIKDDVFKIVNDAQQAIGTTLAAKAEEHMLPAIRGAVPIIQECVVANLQDALDVYFKNQLSKEMDEAIKKKTGNDSQWMLAQIEALVPVIVAAEVTKVKDTMKTDLQKDVKAEIEEDFGQDMEGLARDVVQEELEVFETRTQPNVTYVYHI
ncbi:anonymous antigen 3 [Colletotrichum scovillei]|uniref:Anonymous antigen 3 n=1 Tax=Colletotrichum scovillei TaxID=1209932 RepID=A0A9P7UGS8_9PEZI|nr:anonymous antigen 3 [Colletotrichum scovillei]KAG7071086.1 anonymous antigen 3 [Colletotrichum scovillei]